ncbi:MAG: amidohydrolase family protein [Sphaerochaetaceae bacterium]|nr:amidohydrolase family protein [Sphaerochaetaceae bacterium]
MKNSSAGKKVWSKAPYPSLGVDGSASNDSSDMLGEMRAALMLQRVKYGSDSLSVRDVFRLATVNGAKTLGYEGHLGKIKTRLWSRHCSFRRR